MRALNPTAEQREVIAHPLQPLRVSAGAGTGKTTTMALRLAGLIQREQIEPEAALGITFTNKAAEELTDRLRLHLPELSGMGREVEVTTYHGFAHGVLTEFGPIVGLERDAQLITPGYVRELLTEALAQGTYRYLDVRLPRRCVDELVQLSGRLGDHLQSPSTVQRACPPDPDEVWERRVEMAKVLARYAEIKRRYNAVDYSDLISLAHQVVGEPSIANRIRNRYRVVLLDEYQDTNPAQRELLVRVFGDGFPVTAVGDPDQTIYEWRGASRWNFAGFPNHFAQVDGTPSDTLSLSVNRRSDRQIIAVANRVKERIESDAGIIDLRSSEGAGAGHVEVSWFRDAVEEAQWLAGEVRRLHDEESLSWRDIAVLFRKNRQIHLVREALEDAGIPVEVAALGGLLQVPEVADLHAWLRLIGRPDDAPSLVRILVGSRFRLGLGDLAPLAEWVRQRRSEQEEEPAPGWAMLEAVDQFEGIPDLSDEARRRFSEFRLMYRSLLQEAQAVTLVELSRRVLENTGAWAEVEALDGAARLSARLNLYRFLDLAEDWSPLEGRPSLDAFLDYLDLLDEDRGTEELDTARLSNEDAVAVLTVHRAKGLEWDAVFLPAVASGTFPSSPHGGLEDPDRYARALPGELRLDQSSNPVASLPEQHASQEWRIAYVAVTRARHRLYATGAYWYTTRQEKGPSDLYVLVRDTAGTVTGRVEGEAGSPPPLLRIENSHRAPDPHFPAGWREAVQSTLDDSSWPAAQAGNQLRDFHHQEQQLSLVLDGLPEPPAVEDNDLLVVSATGLVTYATCPQRYYWTSVDPLPRRPSVAARRGREIHRRIELHNLGTVPLQEYDAGPYDETPDTVRAEWTGVDPYEAFLSSRFGTQRPRFVEKPFELHIDARARVRGRIDAIYEEEPGSWEVVDFKSGRPSQDSSARIQLEAYALAVREAGLAPVPPERVRVTFVYLGDGPTEITETVDRTWLMAANARLTGIIGSIRRGHWDPEPGPVCGHCDFLRFCPVGRAHVSGR